MSMNVILISPGFPAEMPHFTRGLSEIGANVLGVGDTPKQALPEQARKHLTAYLKVDDLWNEEKTLDAVRKWAAGHQIDRVECLWEPGVTLAARLREGLGVPGMTVEESIPFRDKEVMKQKLDAAGVRTPRHARARTEYEVRAAAEAIGYPLIVKPIAGAGSADTYPIHAPQDLDEALELIKHVPEVSVEEYIEGEEFTFDTICAGGEILFHNVAWYRPKPLVSRLNPWISSQAIILRDTSIEEVRGGLALGADVLRALNFRTGFTHMEWFLTDKGEAIFGEIGARAPGARLVHAMNYSCNADLFRAWAEAVCAGRIEQDTHRPYNAVLVFKRAVGEGTIQRYEGLDALLAKYGENIAALELTPIGQTKRDWRKVVVGDGWIVARHPNLELTFEMGNHLATDLRIVAG